MADTVVFDDKGVNMAPMIDPVGGIAFHSNLEDIVHVTVDGKWVKRDGRLVVWIGGMT